MDLQINAWFSSYAIAAFSEECIEKLVHGVLLLYLVGSLESRPIKIRPGTYCMGDSAHALQITQKFFLWVIVLQT